METFLIVEPEGGRQARLLRYTDNGVLKHDYHLSNADPATPLSEFARVAQASHRIEE